MKKFIFIIIAIFLSKFINAQDFLNEKINITDGIYCIEDLMEDVQKQVNIPFEINNQGYEISFYINNVKDKPLDVILKPISKIAKIEIKYDKKEPYFLINIDKKGEGRREFILSVDNVNMIDLLHLIAEFEKKELLIKNRKNAEEKITIKCKMGINLENLLETINNNYQSKIVMEKAKIILQ